MNRSPLIISSLSRATLFVLLLTAQSAMAGSEGATGMIASIDKAPVSMDGNLKGKATDFVITLRPPVEPRNMADAGGMTGAGGTRFQGSLLDPKVAGRGLKEGATIKVILPDNFDLSDLGDFPVAGVFSGDDCAPGNLLCTTGVLLQGWPQNPIPPPPNYALSIEGNAIIFTALQDIVPNPPTAPGIKQIHLILHGVENPAAGHHRIKVEAETGPNGEVETGAGLFTVVSKVRSSINLTSVFTGESPAANTIFQETTVNAMAPFEWSFLLWGREGMPLDNIQIRWLSDSHASLRQDGKNVGQFFIDAPAGATGHDVILMDSSRLDAAPVIGATPGIGPQPVGLLQLQFVTGSEPGDYVTTLNLKHGAGSNFWTQVVVTATP